MKNLKMYSPYAVFAYILLLCTILNFLFLQPVLKNGLTGDDWDLIFAYQAFDPNPLSKIVDAWIIKGPYTTIQFYYIGLLEEFLGINYQLFQIINICFKIFASITLFILISKIFKDYLLASVSAIIFSIIHSSAGALSYVVKGTEYLAIGFMNLFFILYYRILVNGSVRLTLFTSLVLLITFLLSPIRLYPLFGVIFLIEIFLIIKNKKISYFLQSLFRVMIFYLPLFFLSIARVGSTSGYLNGITDYTNQIKAGNWHYLLLPFQALGYSLFGNDQLRFLHIPAYLIGILVMLFSMVCFIVWVKQECRLGKIFLLFFGPWFAFLFIISTLAFLGTAFNILESLHWYLIIPSVGISIFISALICLFLEQGVKVKRKIYLFFAFLIFIFVAFVSYFEINRHFNYLLSIGTGARDQTYMQNQVLASINNQDQQNLIAFFDLPDDPGLSHYYQVSLNVGHFGHWLFYFKKPSFQGCISVITDKEKLIQAFKLDDGFYFESDGLCAQEKYNIGIIKTRYSIADFRAFLLKDKRLFNNSDQILEELKSKRF